MAMIQTLQASDGHVFRAYSNGQSGPGLVVVQEIFGLNSHIRSVCDDWAGEGFQVLSPALFDRVDKSGEYGLELAYTPEDVRKGQALAASVGYFEAPLLDIEACLRAFPPDTPVAVLGYCWGGTLAWLSASRLALDGIHLTACVGYYGGMIGKLLDDVPKVPIMLHFGERDPYIPVPEVDTIRKAFPHLPIFTYDAGHGFNCDARDDFDKSAAHLARARSLQFLQRTARGDSGRGTGR